jgi:tRNA pseudouridine synthase 10
MDILEKAAQMLTQHPLCSHCLGRQFALLGHGVNNEDRGKAIKLLLTMKGHQLLLSQNRDGVALLRTVATHGSFNMARDILKRLKKRSSATKSCYLCEDNFENTGALAAGVKEKMGDYEFSTFLVGVELPLEVAEREDEFKARFNVTQGESVKSQFSRDIGKRLSEITGKEVNFKTPDMVILVNPFTGQFQLQINPLFVAGRYRKLVRGIPQSRWLCRECKGRGCESCNWTGRRYEESVEEFVGIPIMEAAEGKEISLHGAGREDVDARMLGTGRPFVLEVKEPKKRFVDLHELERAINEGADGKVEVLGLRFADRNTVRHIKKAEASEKVYCATVRLSRHVSDEELERIGKTLSKATIYQQTPRRVLHRRADLMREKYIYEAKVKRLSRNRAEIRIRCQGGLYIKELITGDEGRTNPNVAGIIGTGATTAQLDVLSVATGEKK